jgi:hypothetical protein
LNVEVELPVDELSELLLIEKRLELIEIFFKLLNSARETTRMHLGDKGFHPAVSIEGL